MSDVVINMSRRLRICEKKLFSHDALLQSTFQ
uniref:Uncharacterized protein n=1 Tax=Parascaris univalens TaxID=6257 RepID=A0A915BQT2_PARUN